MLTRSPEGLPIRGRTFCTHKSEPDDRFVTIKPYNDENDEEKKRNSSKIGTSLLLISLRSVTLSLLALIILQ